MSDDAHRVTFEEVESDDLCWGSGATGLGCVRQATLAVGLCDECHAAISTRLEEGHSRRRSAPPEARVVELDVEISDAWELVARVLAMRPHISASPRGRRPELLEDPPSDPTS